MDIQKSECYQVDEISTVAFKDLGKSLLFLFYHKQILHHGEHILVSLHLDIWDRSETGIRRNRLYITKRRLSEYTASYCLP